MYVMNIYYLLFILYSLFFIIDYYYSSDHPMVTFDLNTIPYLMDGQSPTLHFSFTLLLPYFTLLSASIA